MQRCMSNIVRLLECLTTLLFQVSLEGVLLEYMDSWSFTRKCIIFIKYLYLWYPYYMKDLFCGVGCNVQMLQYPYNHNFLYQSVFPVVKHNFNIFMFLFSEKQSQKSGKRVSGKTPQDQIRSRHSRYWLNCLKVTDHLKITQLSFI